MSGPRTLLRAVRPQVVALALAVPFAGVSAQAQQVTVAGGATLTVSGGGVMSIGAATMDFGATATLVESGGGRIADGTLTATRTLSAPAAQNVGGLGATITSAANLGSVVVTRTAVRQSGRGYLGIARAYDIAPTLNTGLDATLTLAYNDAELSGLTEAALVLYRSTDGGATWLERGGTLDATANTLTLAGIDAFSRWTIAEAGTLPVELSAFAARADGDGLRLDWATESETGNAGWGVELREIAAAVSPAAAAPAAASPAALPWREVAFVAGAGTTSERHSYAHTVTGIAPGRYAIRLVQRDLDGTATPTAEIEVALVPDAAAVVALAGPNPFAESTALRIVLREAQAVRVDLYDALGRHVAALYDGAVDAGSALRVDVPGDGLAPGVYAVRLSGAQVARTVVVTRR